MSKSVIDWYTITIKHHSRVHTGDFRQIIKGPQVHDRIVYWRQLPEGATFSELVRVAEALSNDSKPRSPKATDAQSNPREE